MHNLRKINIVIIQIYEILKNTEEYVAIHKQNAKL